MLVTYGHGTESAQRTVALLAEAGVMSVVDVRIAPGSRRNPQFSRAELERWLPAAGIAYRWEKRLGGFRKPGPENPDVAWSEDMFRGYAEHMRTPEFLAAVEAVLAEAEPASRQVPTGQAPAGQAPAGQAPARQATTAGQPTAPHLAVMCSESLWWRCHRRLIADFASAARGLEVRHLMHDGRLQDHRPSPGLRVREDGLLVYDSGQARLL